MVITTVAKKPMASTSVFEFHPTQVIRSMGSVAVATAGGPSKRHMLRRSVGVLHAAGSRDTSFVEDLALGLGGVDVILNSLTSPGACVASRLGSHRLI